MSRADFLRGRFAEGRFGKGLIRPAPVSSPLELHKLIRQSGCSNVLGICFPMDSNLNIDAWKSRLYDYWDKQIVDLLEFEFPLDFNRITVSCATEDNYASATQFATHVKSYIQNETKHGAVLGTFDNKPIDLYISPFTTIDKPDSDLR